MFRIHGGGCPPPLKKPPERAEQQEEEEEQAHAPPPPRSPRVPPEREQGRGGERRGERREVGAGGRGSGWRKRGEPRRLWMLRMLMRLLLGALHRSRLPHSRVESLEFRRIFCIVLCTTKFSPLGENVPTNSPEETERWRGCLFEGWVCGVRSRMETCLISTTFCCIRGGLGASYGNAMSRLR